MAIPVVSLQKTGQNICAIRKRNGISVRELQSMLGFSNPQAIYKWQHGDCLPTVDNLVALSEIFAIPVDAIIIREDQTYGC